eukprot:GDKJ01016779.1.p1 GENE.GDKJ01016779.1~~GDKJ01016779.1.p1  ORF type:complete len:332 (+),score=45.63 GDKJ01016779.1:27-998(+)
MNKLEAYRHQVGGHCRLVKSGGSVKVYKPIEDNECTFYERLNKSTPDDPLNALLSFIPKFYGTTSISTTFYDEESQLNANTTVSEHIILEDLLHGYKKPCVIDIKLGRRQRKLNATPEKILHQELKALQSTSHSLGFRICGCQFYDKSKDLLCYRDKYWGRKLTTEGVLDMFRVWFWDVDSLNVALLKFLLSELHVLRSIIHSIDNWRFWSCSLLVAYDASEKHAASTSCNDVEVHAEHEESKFCQQNRVQDVPSMCCVKLIDFANTVEVEGGGCDEDVLFGIDNIIKALQKLMECNIVRSDVVDGGSGGSENGSQIEKIRET